jgi:signal transduction histidine kinase
MATAVYLISFAAWSATVTLIAPRAYIEVVSGHFFFVWITIVSVATTYTQEILSRLAFHRNRQREQDAAFIEQLLVEATAADRSKSSFLSILSHELRTPLHQIIGFSDVLKSGAGAGDPGEYLAQINSAAHQMLARVGKMMRYAEAAAGTIKYQADEASAAELVSTLAEQMNERLGKSGVRIEMGRVDPAELRVDFSHTVFALSNLVENAVAASRRGQSVVVSGQASSPEAYRIKIEDSGLGMSAEAIAAAFKPFSIAQDIKSRSTEGIGLGLTLADKIIKDQGGSLHIRSEVGLGTTVYVELPKASGTAGASGTAATAA